MIDVHVHFFPERLARAIRRYFEQHITTQFAYPSDPGRVLEGHASQGVETVWNLPYAHKPGVARGINEAMAEQAESLSGHGVNIIGGATVHPDDPYPADDLRMAVSDLGARVLKLHCSVGSYPPNHPALGDVYDAAAELEVPVVVHAGMSVLGTTSEADLEPLAVAVEQHPHTVFVVAHAGAPAQETVFSMMENLPNLWVDLTPLVHQPVHAKPDQLKRFINRVLMGSDAPNTGIRLEALLRWVDGMEIGRDGREALLRGNAIRLISSSA